MMNGPCGVLVTDNADVWEAVGTWFGGLAAAVFAGLLLRVSKAQLHFEKERSDKSDRDSRLREASGVTAWPHPMEGGGWEIYMWNSTGRRIQLPTIRVIYGGRDELVRSIHILSTSQPLVIHFMAPIEGQGLTPPDVLTRFTLDDFRYETDAYGGVREVKSQVGDGWQDEAPMEHGHIIQEFEPVRPAPSE